MNVILINSNILSNFWDEALLVKCFFTN